MVLRNTLVLGAFRWHGVILVPWGFGVTLYVEVGALLVALFLIFLFLKFIFRPLHIIANSILGIVAFFLLNAFFNLGISITLLSVGVVAVGGVLGLILVVLVHVMGLGFVA